MRGWILGLLWDATEAAPEGWHDTVRASEGRAGVRITITVEPDRSDEPLYELTPPLPPAARIILRIIGGADGLTPKEIRVASKDADGETLAVSTVTKMLRLLVEAGLVTAADGIYRAAPAV